MAIAVALYTQRKQAQGLKMAQAALKLDKKLADPQYLKKNFWGDTLRKDTQKLLNDPAIQK